MWRHGPVLALILVASLGGAMPGAAMEDNVLAPGASLAGSPGSIQPPPPPEEPEPPVVEEVAEPEPEPASPPALYVLLDGVAAGPYLRADLDPLIEAGRVTPLTLVWSEGMEEWTPIKDVDRLEDLLRHIYGVRDAGAVAFLLGRWQSEEKRRTIENYGNATLRETMTIHGDGRFEGRDLWTGLNPRDPYTETVTYEGNYGIQRADNDAIVLSFKGRMTRQYAGEDKPHTDEKIEFDQWYDELDANTIRVQGDTPYTFRRSG